MVVGKAPRLSSKCTKKGDLRSHGVDGVHPDPLPRFPRRSAPSIPFPKRNSQDRRPQFIQLSPMDFGEPNAAFGESFFAYQAAACGVANSAMES